MPYTSFPPYQPSHGEWTSLELIALLTPPEFSIGGSHSTPGADDPDRLWSICYRHPGQAKAPDRKRRPGGAQKLSRSLLIFPHDRRDHESHHWSRNLERWIQQTRRHYGCITQEGSARTRHGERRFKSLFGVLEHLRVLAEPGGSSAVREERSYKASGFVGRKREDVWGQ